MQQSPNTVGWYQILLSPPAEITALPTQGGTSFGIEKVETGIPT